MPSSASIGERAGHVGRLHQHGGVVHREGEQGLHRFGAVDQRQPFLRGQRQRLEPVLAQHLGGRAPGQRIARRPQPPLPDQRLGQVRELGQVTRGAHRALARDDRQQVEREQLEQPGGQLRAHSGVAGRQRPGPQQEDRPHGLVVQRHADRRRVRAHDRALQRGQVGLAHRRVGQRAEPGVHPVHGRAAAERLHHHRTARFHPLRHVRAQRDPCLPVRHRHDIVDGQRASVYHDFSHDRQLPTKVQPEGAGQALGARRGDPHAAAALPDRPRSIQPSSNSRVVIAAASAPFRCPRRWVQSMQAPAKRRRERRTLRDSGRTKPGSSLRPR